MWQERGRQTEPQDDDEDRQTDIELNRQSSTVRELHPPDVGDEPFGVTDVLLQVRRVTFICS